MMCAGNYDYACDKCARQRTWRDAAYKDANSLATALNSGATTVELIKVWCRLCLSISYVLEQ